jgi:hypothetical protein
MIIQTPNFGSVGSPETIVQNYIFVIELGVFYFILTSLLVYLPLWLYAKAKVGLPWLSLCFPLCSYFAWSIAFLIAATYLGSSKHYGSFIVEPILIALVPVPYILNRLWTSPRDPFWEWAVAISVTAGISVTIGLFTPGWIIPFIG